MAYYISTGALSKMYTLRNSYTEQRPDGNGGYMPVLFDVYCCNLSTDEATAERKAEAITGESIASLVGNLEAIQRRKAEAIQASKEEAEMLQAWTYAIYQDEVRNKVAAAVWPFGKHTGARFLDVPMNYTLYMIDHLDGEDNATLIAALNAAFPKEIAEHNRIKALQAGNGEHYGEVKERFKKVPVTVLRKGGFEGFYGWTDVTTYATDEGHIITHMGTRKPCEVGERLLLTATVKEHGEYRDVVQTKVNRPLHHPVS